jgi:hypothetical protein
MVHTKIEITERQLEALKDLSDRAKISLDELVRLGIEQILATTHDMERRSQRFLEQPGCQQATGVDERRRRAVASVGLYASGRTDVSERHDEELTEAFRP